MSKKINFRDMLGVAGGKVLGLHSNQYFDCRTLERAIDCLEKREMMVKALGEDLNALELLGLVTLVRLYESNLGSIENEANT